MTSLPPPHELLPALAAQISQNLNRSTVEGVVSGRGWVSVRMGGRFLWLMARGELRLGFLSDRPFPARWLDLLGRHDRSPFANHLRGQVVDRAQALGPDDHHVDGISLRFTSGRALSLRSWPRPGAIWLTDGREVLARMGRMEGEELTPVEVAVSAGSYDELAGQALRSHLADEVTVTLRRRWKDRATRSDRLVKHLRRDRATAERDLGVRAVADLLAANLHAVRPGADVIDLVDFEGKPVQIELDAALDPAANLARLYKRAAKAERTTQALSERLANAEAAANAHATPLPDPLPTDLEDLLSLADDLELDVTPRRKTRAQKSADTARLPYYVYRHAKGFEIRVGRSAKDNDALLRDHSRGDDLWLHAQGVEGSHVLIRTAGADVPRAVIESAARLTAYYSKARTSSTAGVVVTQRKYVRKPRKAAPGSVVAERAQTIFVEPGLPGDCERESQGQSEPRRR